VNGYTYRSTVAVMGGPPCVPLRKSNREAAGLDGNETLTVRLDLDTEVREVVPPADFVKALKATPFAWDRYQELSFSHRREHVRAFVAEKNPAPRPGRIITGGRMIAARPPRRSHGTS